MKPALQLYIKNITINTKIETSFTVIDNKKYCTINIKIETNVTDKDGKYYNKYKNWNKCYS